MTAITRQSIDDMSYNELVSIVRETNRLPGGFESILEICRTVSMSPATRVLDLGTSTGWTALEIARLTGASVVGVDILEASLVIARCRASDLGIKTVSFVSADVRELPFPNEYFDIIICGNMLVLIGDDSRVFAEVNRVLGRFGAVVSVPMYYLREPPHELVEAVRRVVKVDIPIQYRQQAMDRHSQAGWEIFALTDYGFDEIAHDEVDLFVDRILESDHLFSLSDEIRAALSNRYRYCMQLFRENLSHMGFSVVFLRKALLPVDPPLFTATRRLS